MDVLRSRRDGGTRCALWYVRAPVKCTWWNPHGMTHPLDILILLKGFGPVPRGPAVAHGRGVEQRCVGVELTGRIPIAPAGRP